MKQTKVKIIIATHKKYRMPKDKMYLPLHVGAEGKKDLGYQKDNVGDNISNKNASYCELTGLYWAWKKLDVDYIGLVHYRRYFGKKNRDLYSGILSYKDILDDLGKIKVFIPKKRRYYIETLYSHYAHTHYAEHLDITRKIIEEKYPDYLTEYDQVMRQRWGYMFNMCIMRRTYLDAYCKWLFPILADLEDAMQDDLKSMSAFEARLFGRVSEILFNVWLLKEQESKDAPRVKEVATMHMEPVNWLKKGGAFLKAKFFGRKYGASF